MSSPGGNRPLPYGDQPSDEPRLTRPRVAARALLVSLPAQLLGNFVGSIIVVASGLTQSHPHFAALMVVVGGLLSGVALGMVLKPLRSELTSYVVITAVVGAVLFMLLLGVSQLRLPALAPNASIGSFLLGGLIVAVAQTVVALPLWLRRTAGPGRW